VTYAETFALALGTSQTGLTLKAALVGTDGVIDAAKRDIATGFTEHGLGNYQWVYGGFADGFRGSVVFYVGTLGAATDFSGVAVKASAAAGLVPAEIAESGAIATRDAILNRILSGNHDDTNTVGKILQIIGGAFDADSTFTEDVIDEVHHGPGIWHVPLTIKDSSGQIIPECDVVITTSAASPSSSVVISDTTDGSGEVLFRLNPGTYYIWRQKDGYRFSDPASISVSEQGVVT
jgi:hypothetical protein